MTRESVINQLVYYLNYGFISKELQEDIQEVLLKKKDIFVLERILDSVEYELNKNSNSTVNYKNNNPKIKKDNIINSNIDTGPKINNNINLKNNYNKFDNLINPVKNIRQEDTLFTENNNKKTVNDNSKKHLPQATAQSNLFNDNLKKKNKEFRNRV